MSKVFMPPTQEMRSFFSSYVWLDTEMSVPPLPELYAEIWILQTKYWYFNTSVISCYAHNKQEHSEWHWKCYLMFACAGDDIYSNFLNTLQKHTGKWYDNVTVCTWNVLQTVEQNYWNLV